MKKIKSLINQYLELLEELNGYARFFIILFLIGLKFIMINFLHILILLPIDILITVTFWYPIYLYYQQNYN